MKKLPFILKIKLFFSQITALLIVPVGLIILSSFLSLIKYDPKWNELENFENVSEAQGKITKVINTGYNVENKERAYTIQYSFKSPFDGSEIKGESYTHTEGKIWIKKIPKTILYHNSDPRISTINHKDYYADNPNKPFNFPFILFALFVYLIYNSFKSYTYNLTILENGELTDGELTESVESKNQAFHFKSISYTTKEGIENTSTLKVFSFIDLGIILPSLRSTFKQKEKIIYDVYNPGSILILDSLSSGIKQWIIDKQEKNNSKDFF